MATYNWGVDYTFKADVDLNTSQYKFVKASSTAGNVELQATAGASVIGILQNDPRAGEEATVRVLGFSKVMVDCENSSSPLTDQGFVKCASNGMAQGYVHIASTASYFAIGRAMEAVASGSGQYATIFVLSTPIRAFA